ncbi:hypothetical protein AAG906_025580 [Vitis piasezkii]
MASWKTTLLLLTLFLLSLFLELLLAQATIINSIDGGMNKGCIEIAASGKVWIATTKQGMLSRLTSNLVVTSHVWISDSLLDLKHLNYLDLSLNDFQGIPIQTFERLRYLNLSHGGDYYNFSAPYDSYSPTPSMRVHNLNWLSGLSSLKYLDLGNVNLSKATTNWMQAVNMLPFFHFPQYSNPFVNLTSVSVIDLSYNYFNTTLPGWLFNINLSHNNIGSEGIELVNGLSACANSSLEELNLDGNQVSGQLPDSLGLFKNLKSLDLSRNNIVGPFPNSIQHLTNLESLDLSENSISGPIPTWIGNLLRMKRLDLSNNLMNGTIPKSIGQLRELTELYLNWNAWEGVISEIHFSNLTKLIEFSLLLSPKNQSLRFHLRPEWIPPFSLEFIEFEVLDVSGNLFNGSIPSSISKLKDLENKLSGGIPSWMCSKSSLIQLILGDNNLSGEPFPSLRNCTGLYALDLGNNRFSGEIPKWIGERMPSLEQLRLRGNMLTGDIPEQLCWLSNLHILDLAVNNLSGSIPQCLGNLTTLSFVTLLYRNFDDPSSHYFYSEHMELVVKGQYMEFDSILPIVNLIDLSSNNIWGEIPKEITNLSTLGPIPTTNQFSTFNDPSIYEANLGLYGPPLSTNYSTLNDQDHKDEEEDEDEWDMSWFFISMGLGFPVGFWAVCGSLVLKKSWRQAYFRFIDETRDRLYVFTAVNVARLKRKMEANGVHG